MPPPPKKNHTDWLIDTKPHLSTVDGLVVVQLAYAGRHNENPIRNKPTAIKALRENSKDKPNDWATFQ